MNISLRADEKLYINGAVLRVDRKVTIELLNDVTFLLEAHVMQANDANTPLRQIYFVVQIMPMDPTQSVTQLATISGVQQAMQTNAKLSSLLTTSSIAQAEQLIGHNITSEDGKTSGKVVSVNVTSSDSTATLADGSTISLSS